LLCITLPNVSVLRRFAEAETTIVATTLARMTINSDAKSRCSILPPESNLFEGATRTLKHLCTWVVPDREAPAYGGAPGLRGSVWGGTCNAEGNPSAALGFSPIPSPRHVEGRYTSDGLKG